MMTVPAPPRSTVVVGSEARQRGRLLDEMLRMLGRASTFHRFSSPRRRVNALFASWSLQRLIWESWGHRFTLNEIAVFVARWNLLHLHYCQTRHVRWRNTNDKSCWIKFYACTLVPTTTLVDAFATPDVLLLPIAVDSNGDANVACPPRRPPEAAMSPGSEGTGNGASLARGDMGVPPAMTCPRLDACLAAAFRAMIGEKC